MDRPTLACVVWNDAHGDTSTFDVSEVDHKPYIFTSVGFLIRSDDVGVSLASEIGEDRRYRDHTFIPRVMVIKEWIIGPLKEPRKKKDAPQIPPNSPTSPRNPA